MSIVGNSILKVGNDVVKQLRNGSDLTYASLPLDTVSADLAYSFRNLSSSYTGNVITVRESSGNTTSDFTADEVTDGTLTTFCGSANGFVTKWWDQSGNSRHATQTTAANQPQIVAFGSLSTDSNGKPQLYFNNSSSSTVSGFNSRTSHMIFDTPLTAGGSFDGINTAAYYCVMKLAANNYFGYLLNLNPTSSKGFGLIDLSFFDNQGNSISGYFMSSVGVANQRMVSPSDTNTHLLVQRAYSDAAMPFPRQQRYHADGALIGSNNQTPDNVIGTKGNINELGGTSLSGFPGHQFQQEIIAFDTSTEANPNQTALEFNINTYYDIF
jgi:hypothetical protein